MVLLEVIFWVTNVVLIVAGLWSISSLFRP